MLRCEIFCLCAFVVALGAPLKASQVCTSSQYKKILPSGGYKCDDCPRCPAAYGNLNKCGTTIAYDAKVQCEQCSLGTSYSTENDYSQCLPCTVCAPDVTSTPCTRESNTVCHDKCKSKENYYDKRSRDCQKCSWCCYDGNDELQQDCLKNGMPPNQSCSVRQGKKCGPVSGKTTTHVVSPFTTTATITTSTTEKPTGNPDNTPSLLHIPSMAGGIVSIGILLIGAIIFVIAKIRRGRVESSQTPRRNPEEHPLEASRSQVNQVVISGCGGPSQTSSGNPEVQPLEASRSQVNQVVISGCGGPSQTSSGNPEVQPPESSSKDNQVIPGSNVRLFEWLAKNYSIRVKICSMLDHMSSYVYVARYYKMEEQDINWLTHKDKVNEDFSPTTKLLDALKTGKERNLLISEFCQCLDEIRRSDVSVFLKSEFEKTITSDADLV